MSAPDNDPVMAAWKRREELRLASEKMPEPSEEAIAYGAHVLSEWLDDAAPLNERRYREPARAVLKFASYLSTRSTPTGEVTEPWGWVCNGQGDGWEERDALTHDPVIAAERIASPKWTVRALYDLPAAIRLSVSKQEGPIAVTLLQTIREKADAVLAEHDPGELIPEGPEAIARTISLAKAAVRALAEISAVSASKEQEGPKP